MLACALAFVWQAYEETLGHALHTVYNYKSDKAIESILTILVSSNTLSSVDKF